MIETSVILDAVASLLERSGMRRVHFNEPMTHLTRIFESSEVLVGLAVFETSNEIVTGWVDAEESLARLASERLDAQDPKAWDLYLVLITGDRSIGNEPPLERARIDTKRARKLIVTAGDRPARSVLGAFLRRQIAGLLPIPEIQHSRIDDPVEEVARAFGPSSPVPDLAKAYASGEALMPQLHRWAAGDQEDGEAR